MRENIESFPGHILEALNIAKNITFNFEKKDIKNIVIAGQGGSAIGGFIVQNIFNNKSKVPIYLNKNYKIPEYVNNNTLFIASSYSGNTEETLSALNFAYKKTKKIFCITSGGELLKLAKKNRYNFITIPGGSAPRSMVCFSIIQILYIVNYINNFSFNQLESQLLDVNKFLIKHKSNIINDATVIAKKLLDKIPIIYTFPEFEGVALRFKQQLNENSKMHSFYNIIPEMNHNEIVPWNKKECNLIPIFIRGLSSKRNIDRMHINMNQIKKYVENFILIEGIGTYLNQYFYLINIVDWISLIFAERNNIDPNEIKAIESLKEELKLYK